MDPILKADLATLLFTMVTLVPWVMERSAQIFQPMKMWAALQVVMVSPAAVLVARHPNYIHPDVATACTQGVPAALADALAVYALCNAFVYLSYYSTIGSTRRSTTFFRRRPLLSKFDSLPIVAFLVGIALVGFAVKLSLAGGFSFLLENVSRRVELQRGLGPLNFLIDVSGLIAFIVAVRLYALRGRTLDLVLMLFVFTIIAGTSSLFGGRKITLQLIMTALMIYSAYRPEGLRFSIGTLVLLGGVYLAIIVYFFAVLMYRNSNDADAVIEALPRMFDMAMSSFAEVLMSLSYLDVYVFIVAHFDASNFYYGTTFQDLISAFLPSIFVGDKPPVDDGFYVRYASLGVRVEPGTPATLLSGYASWPPETVGTAYMNGGIWLVPFSGLILGFVLARGYLACSTHPNSLIQLVILSNLFLNFEISNLRIVNLIATALSAMVVIFLLRFGLNLQPPRGTPSSRVIRPGP